MGKDMFVTSGLCRIREQIAASSRKKVASEAEGADLPEEKNELQTNVPPRDPVELPVEKGYDFERLPPETRRALIQREEEYERFRKEALLRLHELELSAGSFREEANRVLEKCSSAEEKLNSLKETLQGLAALDRSRESYRKELAENSRTLDRIRMEMLDVREFLQREPRSGNGSGKKNSSNLFAELDSVTFPQIFRVALALSLPLGIVLLFCTFLVGGMMLLTFRVGL